MVKLNKLEYNYKHLIYVTLEKYNCKLQGVPYIYLIDDLLSADLYTSSVLREGLHQITPSPRIIYNYLEGGGKVIMFYCV